MCRICTQTLGKEQDCLSLILMVCISDPPQKNAQLKRKRDNSKLLPSNSNNPHASTPRRERQLKPWLQTTTTIMVWTMLRKIKGYWRWRSYCPSWSWAHWRGQAALRWKMWIATLTEGCRSEWRLVWCLGSILRAWNLLLNPLSLSTQIKRVDWR